MRAYASLWSIDLLAIRAGVDAVTGEADGFHIDVFDGHNVRELLFGPDLVAALRADTTALLDVHLNVDDPNHWADRFIEAGADMITVQAGACADVTATLMRIERGGARPGLGLELDEPTALAASLMEGVDRVLVMATEIGVRGLDPDPRTPERIRALVRARDRSERKPEIVVDGGIRRHTVASLAAAGADGVIPGSLVFGAPDPVAALRWIRSQRATGATDEAFSTATGPHDV